MERQGAVHETQDPLYGLCGSRNDSAACPKPRQGNLNLRPTPKHRDPNPRTGAPATAPSDPFAETPSCWTRFINSCTLSHPNSGLPSLKIVKAEADTNGVAPPLPLATVLMMLQVSFAPELARSPKALTCGAIDLQALPCHK